jgi:carbon monoxide dehydrogenase subunit G
MKFSTREDIEAPIAHVFDQISDFDAFERRALRQGANVKRMSDGPAVVGTSWEVAFKFRGRTRQVQPTLTQIEHPNGYQIETVSDGMTAKSEVTLVALSPSRTRISVAIDLRAQTLTARLLIQSMKLAKAKLTKRFKVRVLDLAEDIEDGYRKGK